MLFRLACVGIVAAAVIGCSESASPRNSSSRTVGKTSAKSQPATSGSCLNLVNGLDTRDFPTVVRLVGIRGKSYGVCTGTFISPTALITAAHCIDSSANGGVSIVAGDRLDFSQNIMAGSIKAIRAFTRGFIGSTGDTSKTDTVNKDTAIVLFPRGAAKAYAAIAAAKPSPGVKATSVGYGLTDYYDEANAGQNYDASKHYGSIDVVPSGDGSNIYVGDYTTQESEKVLGAKIVDSMGDSGGPLFVNNEITGTLSVGGSRDRASDGLTAYFSVFVDINSADTRELIRIANDAGADIPPPGTPPTNLSSPSTAAPASNSDTHSTCQ